LPIGLAATLPVCRLRCDHFTTLATLTPNVLATSRTECPASTRPTTRTRKSSEYGLVIHAGLHPSQHLESDSRHSGNPHFDSDQLNHALTWRGSAFRAL